ncbi:MAG: MFS transporter, partial [Woeseiaceae bacterium]
MKRITQIVVLIIAGEMIFSLPFHTARFFRPTFLDVFAISNTNLGDIFAIYGITAMLAYFPGGVIADRFSARKLLAVSMLATAAGGFFMATIPDGVSLALLYGYWGVTTILLFWAAMLKATREWGGNLSQGKAFGILDGGRGLVAAAFAVFSVAFMAGYLPEDVVSAAGAEQKTAFRNVILLYSCTTAAVGVLTWFLLPDSESLSNQSSIGNSFNGAMTVLRKRTVWAKAGIVIFAYCGYKGLDNLSLYAVQVLGMNEVEGARLFAYVSYLRPIAAVVAGIVADRFVASRVIGLTFAILTCSFGLLWLAVPDANWLTIIYINIYVSVFAVFAIRGIYFALLQETRTPPELTGTTVGVMSFIGYTPEIFFAPIAGRILDASPGIGGHQNYFLFLATLSAFGLVTVFYLVRV